MSQRFKQGQKAHVGVGGPLVTIFTAWESGTICVQDKDGCLRDFGTNSAFYDVLIPVEPRAEDTDDIEALGWEATKYNALAPDFAKGNLLLKTVNCGTAGYSKGRWINEVRAALGLPTRKEAK